MENGYRLIWFQHFHKAGGTSIVEMAKANRETLYPKNSNGNPVGENEKLLELWKLDERGLTEFIDSCEEMGVTFVAVEWGLPLMDVLKNDSRVLTITCIREPLSRFVSNWYFDLYHGETDAITLVDYMNSCVGEYGAYTMSNYYCRILSRHDNSAYEINEEMFSLARNTISKFDCCVILEKGFASLTNILKWDNIELHARKSNYSLYKIVSFIVRGKFKLLIRRVKYPKKKPAREVVDLFSKNNLFDIRLYELLRDEKIRK